MKDKQPLSLVQSHTQVPSKVLVATQPIKTRAMLVFATERKKNNVDPRLRSEEGELQ